MNRIIRISIVGAAALAVVPVSAEPPVTVTADTGLPTARVSFGDLNLGSASGLAALHRRVRHAAQILCGKADSSQLKRLARKKRCVGEAIGGAQTQIARAVADFETNRLAARGAIEVAAKR